VDQPEAISARTSARTRKRIDGTGREIQIGMRFAFQEKRGAEVMWGRNIDRRTWLQLMLAGSGMGPQCLRNPRSNLGRKWRGSVSGLHVFRASATARTRHRGDFFPARGGRGRACDALELVPSRRSPERRPSISELPYLNSGRRACATTPGVP
jgi:hypothetical protein